MESIKNKFKSIRVKLFLTLCIVVIIIIAFLILTNNFVLESFYLHSKTQNLIGIYKRINNYYLNEQIDSSNLQLELKRAAINNNFDILIKSENNISVYSTNRDFLSNSNDISSIETMAGQSKNIIYKNEKIEIRKFEDKTNGITFLMFSTELDNGYKLYIRMPFASIRESVRISNNFLYLFGGITILIGGIVVLFISKKFTSPILELNEIANKNLQDVQDGFNTVSESISKMNEITDANITIIDEIKKLNEQIENIWYIVNIISGIADQTKIIAFNAELEAASAGEAGKNFHIVANEIRRLADNTMESTKDIKQRISDIQHSSDSLILASEGGTKKINEGFQLSVKLEDKFNNIKMI